MSRPTLWKLLRSRWRRNLATAAIGRARAPQSGLSLLEVLIAAALILTIAVAILPLFISASANNQIGRDASIMASSLGESVESFYPMPFHGGLLAIAAGTTETVTTEVWVPTDLKRGEGDWMPESSYTTDLPMPVWTRTVTVRQYGLGDLEDNKMLDTRLDGSAPESAVHLKEITLEMVSAKGKDEERRKMILRLVKSF